MSGIHRVHARIHMKTDRDKKFTGRILKMGILSLGMMALFTGCRKKEGEAPETPLPSPVEITEVQEITFSRHESAMPEIAAFTLTRAEEGTQVCLETAYEEEYLHMEDAGLMDQVREILERNEVGDWNGFHGNNSRVLDGGGFSIYVEFTDGTTLSASGENCFPAHYQTVASELTELIQPTRKRWYEEQYPKVIEDTSIDTFAFRVSPSFSSAQFECSFETRPDDPGKRYMRVSVKDGDGLKHPECSDYFFYGVIPEPPYEALQEIVERYHLAAWNGYNEFLPSAEAERTFYLSVQYESGESIFAVGSLLPENYAEAENELIQVIWNYIQEHQDEFTAWE